jgi:hypothetical protein
MYQPGERARTRRDNRAPRKENRMRKMHVAAWVGAAVALLGTGALAGSKSNPTVVVDTVVREAFGSLGSARNSADAVQYIGCTVVSSAASTSVSCTARNSAGTIGSCTSTNATLVDAARNLDGDAYIYFSWDAGGSCTLLSVAKSSVYTPKTP